MAENLINAHRIVSNPTMYDQARTNAFRFIVTGINNLTKIGTEQTFDNPQNSIEIAVKTCTTPSFSQNPIEVRRGNLTLKTAGTPTFNDINITFSDFIGVESKSVLMAWQSKNFNMDTATVGDAKDYLKTCYLQEYTADFSRLIRTYTLYNCFISSLSQADYNSENSDARDLQATLSYSYYKVEEL